MTPTPGGPVDRVRSFVREASGPAVAEAIPSGFQRVGDVVLVRLPETLRPSFPVIGEAYRRATGAVSVLRRNGGIVGEFRVPQVERIAGDGTETEVLEHGIRYRFDAAQVMFSAGNHTERRRVGSLVRPGETVVDLFAGIGYLTLPAAVLGRAARVHACEANPVSVRYLTENVRLNGVPEVVRIWPGDNRDAPLPLGTADRLLLGLLPDSLPYVPRALPLLRPDGGWVHVHRLLDARAPEAEAIFEVRALLARLGARAEQLSVHRVKPYSPGRIHVVVEGQVRPGPT